MRIRVDISADGASGTITIPSSSFTDLTTPWSAPKHGYSYVGGIDMFGREFETRLALF
jgi:hypothetical protein